VPSQSRWKWKPLEREFKQEQGRLEDAIKAYRESLQLPDQSAQKGDFGLAQLLTQLAQQGPLEEAIEAYRKVLRINPQNAHVQLKLGALLAGQGHPADSPDCFEHQKRGGDGITFGQNANAVRPRREKLAVVSKVDLPFHVYTRKVWKGMVGPCSPMYWTHTR